jgi:membrane-associated phospholipid phosphatase
MGSRFVALLPLKMAGTAAAMAAFFAAYFWLLRHSRSPVTTVPRIFVDRMISFRPAAVGLYVSLWVYVTLPPSLMTAAGDLRRYLAAGIIMSLLGFAVFVLWPTTIPTPDFNPAMYPSVSYLKTVDASGNAFPSLHVAFAVLTVFCLGKALHESGAGMALGVLNWIWCLGIIYSTMAIRQHVALDAISGAVLGGLVAFAYMRLLCRRPADVRA